MKKITLYQADDGRIFDNSADCKEHELKERLKKTGIKMYDNDGNEFSIDTFLSSDTYNSVEKVSIKTEMDVADIEAIYDFTGFYADIDHIGTWVWHDKEQKFLPSVTA